MKITSPAHKAQVSGTITVEAEVSSPGPVAYVVLVVDGTRPASRNAAPWKFELDTCELTDGPHVVSAEAYDSRAMIVASKAITLRVKNGSSQPALVAKQQPRPAKVQIARTPLAKPILTRETGVAPVVIARGPVAEPARTASAPTASLRPAVSTPVAVPATPVAAAAPAVRPPRTLAVVMDGTPVDADVSPALLDGRLHTSLRALFLRAGARIEWLADQRTARCVSDSLTVEVPVGSRIASVNGRHVDMGAVATIKDGRTVVPLQFFAQVTGSRLSWDPRTGVACVQTPGHALASVPASLPPAANMPTLADNTAGMRTPIHEVADRAP